MSTSSTFPRATCACRSPDSAATCLQSQPPYAPAGADKDHYDFAYVLLHNHAGGPTEAASVVNSSPLADVLPGMSSTFLEIRERFRNDRAYGARAYAREARKVTPEDDERLLAADAAAAVNEFLNTLTR